MTARFAAKTKTVTTVVDEVEELTAPLASVGAQVPATIRSLNDKVGALTVPVSSLTSAASSFAPFVEAVDRCAMRIELRSPSHLPQTAAIGNALTKLEFGGQCLVWAVQGAAVLPYG